jgi:hypothetical protein
MQKKGQSALEFLTTYGWAFMLMLTLVGGLAYFGVLSPSQFIPDSCASSTGFTCSEAGFASESSTIILQNGPNAITFTGTPKATIAGAPSNCDFSVIFPDRQIRPKERFEVQVVPNPGCQLPANYRANLKIESSYRIANDPFPKSFFIEVGTTIRTPFGEIAAPLALTPRNSGGM